MTTDEAIRRVEMAVSGFIIAAEFDAKEHSLFNVAREMAIAALHAQQEAEKNDPLTMDELKEMEGEPVYVIWDDEDFGEWGIVEKVDADTISFQSGDWHYLEDYGVWLAYRRPPKEKENE